MYTLFLSIIIDLHHHSFRKTREVKKLLKTFLTHAKSKSGNTKSGDLDRDFFQDPKSHNRSPSLHPHLLNLLHCRVSLVSLSTLTSLIQWPHLQLPSIPQESTRRMLNSPSPLATVIVDELTIQVQKRRLAVSNIIALERSCEAFFFLLLFKPTWYGLLANDPSLTWPLPTLHFESYEPIWSAMLSDDQHLEAVANSSPFLFINGSFLGEPWTMIPNKKKKNFLKLFLEPWGILWSQKDTNLPCYFSQFFFS